MKKVKWLLVGAGGIATTRVGPALVETKNSELAAICDLHQDRAAKLADRFKVKTIFTDYDKALAESEVDSVYIATNPYSEHVELCMKALKAGKHFLCEKPLGVNGEECLKLLKAVRKTDRIGSCSNYRRLSEQYKETKKMLKRQEIGALNNGWMVYAAPFLYSARNNYPNFVTSKALGDGAVNWLGYYIIDIAINLFGMPTGVMAQNGLFDKSKEVEYLSAIIMRFKGGEIFTIFINFQSQGPTRHKLELFGSEGRIYWPEWPPHGNGPIFKITKDGTAKVDTHTNPNFHIPMIDDFVGAVLNGRQPVCALESAVKTAVVTEAILRSAESGKLEPVIWKG